VDVRPVLRVARAVLALGGAAVLLVPAFSAHAETAGVQTTADNKFAPSTVTINPGDSVRWTNNGGLNHTVTNTSTNWTKNDSIPLQTTTTSYKFDDPGRYTYHCNTHATMKGTVVVRAPKPSPTPTSPRPTATRTTTPPASSSPTATRSASPSPSLSNGTPVIPSGTPPASPTPTSPPLPTVVPTDQQTLTSDLGTGGLRAQPATGRGKGLPVMLALLLVGGVGSAELMALLAYAPE
jgi:plastocyanin